MHRRHRVSRARASAPSRRKERRRKRPRSIKSHAKSTSISGRVGFCVAVDAAGAIAECAGAVARVLGRARGGAVDSIRVCVSSDVALAAAVTVAVTFVALAALVALAADAAVVSRWRRRFATRDEHRGRSDCRTEERVHPRRHARWPLRRRARRRHRRDHRARLAAPRICRQDDASAPSIRRVEIGVFFERAASPCRSAREARRARRAFFTSGHRHARAKRSGDLR